VSIPEEYKDKVYRPVDHMKKDEDGKVVIEVDV
jgi:hypothetical protein